MSVRTTPIVILFYVTVLFSENYENIFILTDFHTGGRNADLTNFCLFHTLKRMHKVKRVLKILANPAWISNGNCVIQKLLHGLFDPIILSLL